MPTSLERQLGPCQQPGPESELPFSLGAPHRLEQAWGVGGASAFLPGHPCCADLQTFGPQDGHTGTFPFPHPMGLVQSPSTLSAGTAPGPSSPPPQGGSPAPAAGRGFVRPLGTREGRGPRSYGQRCAQGRSKTGPAGTLAGITGGLQVRTEWHWPSPGREPQRVLGSGRAELGRVSGLEEPGGCKAPLRSIGRAGAGRGAGPGVEEPGGCSEVQQQSGVRMLPMPGPRLCNQSYPSACTNTTRGHLICRGHSTEQPASSAPFNALDGHFRRSQARQSWGVPGGGGRQGLCSIAVQQE